jgi:methylated-DNA-[protein]-cysteine S-methyltransferase
MTLRSKPVVQTCEAGQLTLAVFPSSLGWMALVAGPKGVRQLVFGHRSAAAAEAAIDPSLVVQASGDSDCEVSESILALIERLQAYARGEPADFSDVPLDLDALGSFQRRVMGQCRRIPFGKVLTYGQLAAKVGTPGAARAVGNCMAANRIPLMIPCHRVVRSGGGLGKFSAPGGVRTKRRLLALEGLALPGTGRGLG